MICTISSRSSPVITAFSSTNIDEAAERGEVTDLSSPIKNTRTAAIASALSTASLSTRPARRTCRSTSWSTGRFSTGRVKSPRSSKHRSWVTDIADYQRECPRAHARRPRPLADRERDLQHPQEPRLQPRPQLRLGQEALKRRIVHLTMLAFLVDQLQQLCCPLFQPGGKSAAR